MIWIVWQTKEKHFKVGWYFSFWKAVVKLYLGGSDSVIKLNGSHVMAFTRKLIAER